MDLLPHSVEGGLAAFAGLVTTVVLAVIRAAKSARRADDRRMQSVPPSETPEAIARRLDVIAQRLDTRERELAIMYAKWREQDLIERVGTLEKELREAREDLEQARRAYADEREKRLRVERELARERAATS
jgi:predicted ribosome quality control (RQC) complex YloA/Tae2 family protein